MAKQFYYGHFHFIRGSQPFKNEIVSAVILNSFFIWRWLIMKIIVSDAIGLIIKRSHSDHNIIGGVCNQDTSASLRIRHLLCIFGRFIFGCLPCFINLIVNQNKKYKWEAFERFQHITHVLWTICYDMADMAHIIWVWWRWKRLKFFVWNPFLPKDRQQESSLSKWKNNRIETARSQWIQMQKLYLESPHN